MAKKTAKTSAPRLLTKPFDFESSIDEVGQSLDMLPVNLARSNMIEDALATGNLCIDLITGGGYIPGSLITVRGETGAGKSTILYSSIKNSARWGIPVFFLDYEGSTQGSLVENIIGRPLQEILGAKDAKGNYIIEPLMRYIQPDVGQAGFRYISRALQQIPKKKEIDGKWYLEYSSDWAKDIQGNYDFIRKNGKYYVETTAGGAQAIFFIDSYASMLPEALDENDEANPMAQKARMFSEYLPLIKGKLASRRCTVVATNQMRLKPMAMFSDPRYEPGGQALGFYPDLVLDASPVSASTIKEGKGQVIEEECWDGKGKDRYKFSRIKTIKNKKYSPFRSSLLKIWFESKGVSKGGFCPVFDTRQYLRETGQIEEGKTLQLKTGNKVFDDAEFSDKEFKALILSDNRYALYKEWGMKDEKIEEARKDWKAQKTEKGKASALAKLKKLANERLDLRQLCTDQIATGEAFKLYAAALSGAAAAEATGGKGKKGKDDDNDSTDMGDE